jgi:hypothetical protein
MKKIFISLMFICIVLWVAGLLFLNMGIEVHLFLFMAAMSFSLKLLTQELTKGA